MEQEGAAGRGQGRGQTKGSTSGRAGTPDPEAAGGEAEGGVGQGQWTEQEEGNWTKPQVMCLMTP